MADFILILGIILTAFLITLALVLNAFGIGKREHNYKKIIDSEPKMRHGKWIFTGKETLFSREVKCNQCETKQLGETPYCPNCGACMDGGKK